MSSLEDRVAALEALVDELLVLQGEALVPNYLTIDPTTGVVGGAFPGGASVPEISSATVPPPLAQSFNFTPPLHGPGVNGLVGYLLAVWDAGSAFHAVTLRGAADTADYASLSLHTKESGALGQSAVIASVADTVGTASVTVADSAGDSSFVQILSPNVPIRQQLSRVSRVYLSAGLSITTAGAWQLVALDTIDAQPDIPWNSATHVFQVPVTGRYHLTGTVNMTNNIGASSPVAAGFMVNGGVPINHASDTVPNTANWIKSYSDKYNLTVGSTVGLAAWANSIAGFGTPINSICSLSIQLVG